MVPLDACLPERPRDFVRHAIRLPDPTDTFDVFCAREGLLHPDEARAIMTSVGAHGGAVRDSFGAVISELEVATIVADMHQRDPLVVLAWMLSEQWPSWIDYVRHAACRLATTGLRCDLRLLPAGAEVARDLAQEVANGVLLVPHHVSEACWGCDARAPAGQLFRKCSGCRLARYCDAACQRRNWRGHKRFCQGRHVRSQDATTIRGLPALCSECRQRGL